MLVYESDGMFLEVVPLEMFVKFKFEVDTENYF